MNLYIINSKKITSNTILNKWEAKEYKLIFNFMQIFLI